MVFVPIEYRIKFGKKVIDYSKFKFLNIKDIEDFNGNSPPSIFVGSKLPYPNVNVGILSPPEKVEDAWLYDAQSYWAQQNFSIVDIVALRSSLINSRFRSNVHEARNSKKFLELSQEIAMAIKPVEVEIELKKKVKMSLDFDNVHLPMGPRAPLKNIKVIENVSIPHAVNKVVSDFDLKAKDAILYLADKGYAEDNLTKILSVGVLGLRKNRKLVPTKWSITAIDDLLGKNFIEQIKNYPTIDKYQLFLGEYLGNYYLILMFPEIWNYELFETYLPGSSWNKIGNINVATDYENYYGRKGYAENCGGGYYANRMPVTSHLAEIKRQASVLVFRFELPTYYRQLGVFVVRESTRKALSNKPITFESKNEILNYVKNLVFKKFNFDIEIFYKRSKLLKGLEQLKLTNFLVH